MESVDQISRISLQLRSTFEIISFSIRGQTLLPWQLFNKRNLGKLSDNGRKIGMH